MKLSFAGVCFILFNILIIGNTDLQAGALTQTHQWIQIIEDRQKQQDSIVKGMSLEISNLRVRIDSLLTTQHIKPAETANTANPAIKKEQGISNLLLALFAGLAGLLAIAVSIFVPFYFFRENHRLREEVRGLMFELQRIKTSPSSQEPVAAVKNTMVRPETISPPSSVLYPETDLNTGKPATPEYTPKQDKEFSTIEFITRLELCIMANQEDEFNHVVAEMVQSTASREMTAILRFLHRLAACVFRGRMPAQAPVMAEIKQFLWGCETPVYYQTEKIVTWARSSTRLSDAQRAYIFSISSEMDKMLAEHNRHCNQ